MMSTNMKALFEILKEKSFRLGEVKLRSGKMSDYYLDVRKTALDPEGASLIGRILYARIVGAYSSRGVAAVGGLTLGADPIATAISLTSALAGNPIPAFIVRKEAKEHGAKDKIVNGEVILNGSRQVVVVEDVMTTGESAGVAVKAVQEYGGTVAAVMAVVDREDGGEEYLRGLGVDYVTAIFKGADFKR